MYLVRRLQHILLVVIGGLIYLTVFYLRYSLLDPDLFQYRDDAVITMSVGRHIVDYGFVGVSPSGPIVDASSSPLQTALFALVYRFSAVDYAAYSWLQTYVATFALGAVFTAFFLSKFTMALPIATISAIGLTFFYPFFLWHASGMENSLTHVLYLLSVYLLYRMIRDARIFFGFAVPLFLATIVRSESVLHITILLLCFSVCWSYCHHNYRALLFSLVVGAIWSTFQFGRWIYFGDIVPNTAYAQGISVSSNLRSLVLFDLPYIYSTARICAAAFIRQGSWIGVFAFPMYRFVPRTQANRFLLMSVSLLTCSLLASPFLFGRSRIDVTRTTTQIVPLLFLLIGFSVVHAPSRATLLKPLLAFLVMSIAVYHLAGLGPYYLGWSTRGFDQVRSQFQQLAREHRILRPTIANPDLGVMTWHKEFNLVDLGMLGTPEMARLSHDSEIRRFFFEYALPDFVESHNPWTKKYCQSIFLADEFERQYEMLYASDKMNDICEGDAIDRHFWIRRDMKSGSQSAERKFLDSLQEDLSVPRVAAEISACRTANDSCAYVVRTVFRFIPELRSKRQFDQTLALFPEPNDRAILEGWRDARARTELIKVIRSR